MRYTWFCFIVGLAIAAPSIAGHSTDRGDRNDDTYLGYGEPGKAATDSGSPEKLWRESEEAGINHAVRVIEMPPLSGRKPDSRPVNESEPRTRRVVSRKSTQSTSATSLPRLRRIAPPSERVTQQRNTPSQRQRTANNLGEPVQQLSPLRPAVDATPRQQDAQSAQRSTPTDPSQQLARMDSMQSVYPAAVATATDATAYLPVVDDVAYDDAYEYQDVDNYVYDDVQRTDAQRIALAELEDAQYTPPPVTTRSNARVTYEDYPQDTRIVRYYPAPTTTYVYRNVGYYRSSYCAPRYVYRPYRYYGGCHYPRYRHYPSYRGCGRWGFSVGYRGSNGGFRYSRSGGCSSTSIFLKF